jgi:hypothetical protein
MIGLEELLRAAAALETVLRRCRWLFCFIAFELRPRLD